MSRDRSLDIAVTGMAARLPGADGLADWWRAVLAGQVLTSRLDPETLRAEGVAEDVLGDPAYVPVRGLLADPDRFENGLFGISPREAELMDPQQRLLLETAWAALEDAGQGPVGPAPVTAVFAATSGSGYLRRLIANGVTDPEVLEQVLLGCERDFAATRIAYRLGLTGPALTVLTACSSSLVAVHLAAQALINGECDQAVVVAASVDFPQAGHLHVPGGILSATGACRPFDADADGTLAGSGAAGVVLRRLDDALDDGSVPHGVILGSAINNDGVRKAGYSAPSATGQEAVIRAALRAADVGADSLGYLEAHATGTRVGDPIEWSAASAAFGGPASRPGRIAVGAVKANIGHLDAAAGLISLIKATMVVRDAAVPPVAGFSRLNPLLDTAGSPLYVPREGADWNGAGPRRAGVSSFGIGGTNAHVIVEQPPAPPRPPAADGRERLVLISAADPDAVRRSARRLAGHLETHDLAPADVAHTLAAGRAALPYRLAVTGQTGAEIAAGLTGSGRQVAGHSPADGPAPVVFLLPGQGAQSPGMALPFLAHLPSFEGKLEECLAAFEPAQARRLHAALLDRAFPEAELEATELAQPALFAVEYAAATALEGLGLRPVALVGHSLGEITAACLAGVLELPLAARLVAVRGRAMQDCPTGVMLALPIPVAEAGRLLSDSGAALDIAAVNSADSCVLAGPAAEAELFEKWLDGRVPARRLRTSHAFHSALIEPAAAELRRELAGRELGRLRVPFTAGATGELIPAGAVVSAGHFAEQARRPVLFGQAIAAVAERFPGAVAVEVGPGKALSGMAEAAGLDTVPLAADRTDDAPLLGLGALWAMGQPVDPAALTGPGRRVHLPGYPFAGPRFIAAEVRPRPVAPTQSPAGAAQAEAARAGASGAVATPAQDTQSPRALVAAGWTELLGHPDAADDADFFELGGDSLIVTRLARRLGQQLGVAVPVRELLIARTLGGQAEVVRGLLSTTAEGS
ncbi:beta-ketoacyl synthase N-terminal-like domain-containing protein [Streptomyces sp. NPDC048506]|uniref:type I polyketide synthase n=1 Tax=Streptomyces sp. NPDC048506 TaxID=3155028 RepID=UPI00342B473D